MDIEIIRYFGAAYVMESNLQPKEKCNLIDYIKEAEWDEVLNLVFNGNKPNRKLTINEQYILEAQAENYVYPLILRYLSERKKDKKKTRKDKAAAGGSKRPSAYQQRKMKKQSEKVFDPKKAKSDPRTLPPDKPAIDPKATKNVGKKAKDVAKDVGKKEGDVIKHAKSDLDVVYTNTKEKIKSGGKYIAKKGRSIAPGVKRYTVGGGALVLIAAATAAGHRVYKLYLTQAARQCKNLSGPEKRACIVKHRKAGYQAKMNSYIKARSDCGKTNNPERCQRELNNKIKKVKYKMGTLYSRL